MDSFVLNSHLFPLFTFLVGGLILLLLSGLACRRNLVGRVFACGEALFCLSLIGAGVAAIFLQLEIGFWVPLFVLAGFDLLFSLLPSPAGRTMLAGMGNLLTTPRARCAAILLGVGLAIATSLVITLNTLTGPPEYEFTEGDIPGEVVNLAEVDTSSAFTDRGRPIVLKTSLAANAGRLDAASLQHQFAMLGTHGLRDQVIHIPVGWQNSNCHGWVFTAGQFWVTGDQVETILRDNQYRESTTPKPGDVAVYRSPESAAVTHTGIVRYVSPSSDIILVESKWGRLGRFLHRHDTHCYGLDECTFYRSARIGHRLRGLESDPSAQPPMDMDSLEQYTPIRTPSGMIRF